MNEETENKDYFILYVAIAATLMVREMEKLNHPKFSKDAINTGLSVLKIG